MQRRNGNDSPRNQDNALSGALLRHLWGSMASCYGHLWTSAYGDDATNEAAGAWSRGLAGLGAGKIQAGIEAAARSKKTHPPTLPEFRSWCVSDGEQFREPTKEEIRALAEQNEADDRAHFKSMNKLWRETHNDDLYDIDRCIYTRSRYLSDAEKSLRRRA